MKYRVLIALAAVALIAAGCNKAANNETKNEQTTEQNNQEAPAPTQQTPAPTQQSGSTGTSGQLSGEADIQINPDMPEVFEVQMTDSGFSPASITIKKGDYIQFTNKGSNPHWPASSPHPAHTGLPGFDADKGIQPGDKYRFQFNTVGTWPYHDHLNPSLRGTVVVQ